jgi:hypothetical protein
MQMFRPEKVFSQKNTQTDRLGKSIMLSTTQMKSTQAIGKKPQLQLGSQVDILPGVNARGFQESLLGLPLSTTRLTLRSCLTNALVDVFRGV